MTSSTTRYVPHRAEVALAFVAAFAGTTLTSRIEFQRSIVISRSRKRPHSGRISPDNLDSCFRLMSPRCLPHQTRHGRPSIVFSKWVRGRSRRHRDPLGRGEFLNEGNRPGRQEDHRHETLAETHGNSIVLRSIAAAGISCTRSTA